MKGPRILIIGTGSLLNYGCEAIVQGSYLILKEAFPDCSITLASDDKEYDRHILPSDIILQTYRKRFTPYRIAKGIMRRLFHIGNGSEVRVNTSIGKKYDIVLSCGGDNFCETPDWGIYNLLVDLMAVGEKSVKKGRKYFLWGASAGPFHNYDIERRVVSNLSLTKKIFIREDLSLKYLSQFENIKDKLCLIADPAFQMRPLDYSLDKEQDKIYVGINMSLLAVYHAVANCDINIVLKTFAVAMNELLSSDERIRLVLIPHVVMSDSQNDMNFLTPVYDRIIDKTKVKLIQPGLGARKTKSLIKQLDLLVAARMHCCVAGISSGTPTLFITYSPKGKGMSQYAYGHHEYEFDCADMIERPELLVRKIKNMLTHKDEIKYFLINRSETFLRDSMLAGYELKKSLKY